MVSIDMAELNNSLIAFAVELAQPVGRLGRHEDRKSCLVVLRPLCHLGEIKYGTPKLCSRKAGTSFFTKDNKKRIINYYMIFSSILY